MMNFINRNAGLVGLIALFIAIIAMFFSQLPSTLGAIVDTSYFDYFDAKLGFKVNGTTVIDSTGVVSGGAISGTTGTFSSTLGVTGQTTLSATTTLSDTVNFNNPGICINFYATSTATRLHLVASTTPVLPGGAAAVMTAEYGACNL